MALPPIRRNLPPAPANRRQPQGGILSNLKSLQGYDGGTGAFGAHINKGSKPEPRVAQKPQESTGSKADDSKSDETSRPSVRSEKTLEPGVGSRNRQKSASPPRGDDKESGDTGTPTSKRVGNTSTKQQNDDREPVKSHDRDKHVRTPEDKGTDRNSEGTRPSSSRMKEPDEDVKHSSSPTRRNSARADRNDPKQRYSPITRKRDSPNHIRTDNRDSERKRERSPKSTPRKEPENINTREKKREAKSDTERPSKGKPRNEHKKDSSPRRRNSGRSYYSSDDTERETVKKDRDNKKKARSKSENRKRDHRDKTNDDDDDDDDDDASSDNNKKHPMNSREKQKRNRQTARKSIPSSASEEEEEEEESTSPDIVQSPERTKRRGNKKQARGKKAPDSRHTTKDKRKAEKNKGKAEKKVNHVSRRDKEKAQSRKSTHKKDRSDKMDRHEKKGRKRSESHSSSEHSDSTDDEKDFAKSKGTQRSASLESRTDRKRHTRKLSPSPKSRQRNSHRNRSVEERVRTIILPPQYVCDPNPAYYPAPALPAPSAPPAPQAPYINHNMGYTYEPLPQPNPSYNQAVIPIPAHNTIQYPTINNAPYVYEYSPVISTGLPQQHAAPPMVYTGHNWSTGNPAIQTVQTVPQEALPASAPVQPLIAPPANIVKSDTTTKIDDGAAAVVNRVYERKKKKPRKVDQQSSTSEDSETDDDDDDYEQRITEKTSGRNKGARKTNKAKNPKLKQSSKNHIPLNQQNISKKPDREYKRMLKDFQKMFPNQTEGSHGAGVSNHPDSKLSNREYVERLTDGSLPFLRDLNSLRDNVNASQEVRKSTSRH